MFLTAETITLQTILTSISSFISSAITWIGQFANVIVENPLILAFVIVAFVGLAIGLIQRLIQL